MRIVEIIPTIRDGGAETFVIDFCNNLIAFDEVQLYLIVLHGDRKTVTPSLDSRVHLCFLNIPFGIQSLMHLPKLRKHILSLGPDVIHTHVASINYVALALCYNVKAQLKWFHTLHNMAEKEYASYFGYIQRSICSYLDTVHFIGISENCSESFYLLYKKTTLTTIVNGKTPPNLDNISKHYLTEIRKRYNDECILYVHIGRICEQKNQIEMIKAFERFTKSANSVLLILGKGEGIYYEQFMSAYTELATDRIRLVGYVNNPLDYLYNADYFLLPSIYEGVPISLLEAISVGTCPIVTNVGGVGEIVSSSEAIFSKGFDELSIYQALRESLTIDREKVSKRLIETFKKNHEMKDCSREYFKTFLN